MNVSILLLIAGPLFLAAYYVYGKYLDGIFGSDDRIPTPAVTMNDGNDYVPTKPLVVFSHHFASIAGAGPIIGPTTALLFGYAPAWIWIVVGGIFMGAVHDYTALFISMREKGESMATVSGKYLGRWGFGLFIGFTIAMIVLVTSAFLGLTATALGSLVPVKDLMIDPANTLLHIKEVNGVQMGSIGGIASTSVIVMTCFAPIVGWLMYKKNIPTWQGAALAAVVGLVSIIAGLYFPVTINPKIWMVIIAFYTLIAAGVPVWALLQPRDFTNSFILYFGIAILLIGVIGGAVTGVELQAPAWNIAGGEAKMGTIWPFLFITIACGAISGFHNLVAAGTVSKQVPKESLARPVGYGGMILESLLAVVVLLAVAGGLKFDVYQSIVYPTAKGVASNPMLAFSLSMGMLLNKAIGTPVAFGTVFGILMVEGFVVTTLDTAVRLNRYLFEELWTVAFKGKAPAFMKSYLFNAGLSVVIMFYLGYTNVFQMIWPIFGSANQLLAALSLIAVTVWLAHRKKPTWFTIIPAVFMLITTLVALYKLLMTKYLPAANWPLVVTDVILIVMSIGVSILALSKLFNPGSKNEAAPLAKTGD
ncbi:MAG TPA: carbon starvation CstA family protein [Symbiobacteriaceae bacterium]|nr:carbon starvation CstA family protein [Symbiobacteriaceae bacterium]